MAELILKIGSPIKVLNKNYTVYPTCYYLGQGFIIYSFDPNVVQNPRQYISHLLDYGSAETLRIYPYENMDKSTFAQCTCNNPRYRNSVGDFLQGDDFKFTNLRDFDLIKDSHLNEFEWFAEIRKIIEEKLANV